MKWPLLALDDALAFIGRHALVLAFLLAFLPCLIILWQRLCSHPQSCEDHTVPDTSISSLRRNRRKARTKLPLSSLSGRGDHRPTQPAEGAQSLADSEADEDKGKDRMARRTKQPYEAFLVLDVEGTCVQGSGFGYPNEIIVRPYFISTSWPHVRINRVSLLSLRPTGMACLPPTVEG